MTIHTNERELLSRNCLKEMAGYWGAFKDYGNFIYLFFFLMEGNGAPLMLLCLI